MSDTQVYERLVQFLIDELDKLDNDDDRIDAAIDGLLDAQKSLKELRSGRVFFPPNPKPQWRVEWPKN